MPTSPENNYRPGGNPEHGTSPHVISEEEHARLITETHTALAELVESEAWQAAVAPHEPGTDIEVFVVYPEQTDWASVLRREGADRLNDFEFAAKDGDDPRETRQEFAPYKGSDIRILIVRHTPDLPSEPIAAMRLIGQTPGLLPHSLAAIETEWGKDVQETILRTHLPDGTPLPYNLKTHNGVYDIALASVAGEYRKGGAKTDERVLMALYSAALKVVQARGGKFILGAMDVEGVFDQLQRRGPRVWGEFIDIERKTIMSRVPGSNISTAAIGDVERWEADTAVNRKVLHGLLWGDLLAKRGVAFTGIDETAQPLFDTMPRRMHLSPALLKTLPHATPYLYMDLEAVGERYDTFAAELPDFDVHYAMKCNPHKKLLKYLNNRGSSFEIASAAELERLRQVGVEPSDVLFSNPVKIPEHIRRTGELGVYRFAFDSYQELEKIADNAPGASVYVRLATSQLDSKVHSEGKFGTDRDSAVRLLKVAGELGLRAYGLAFHVGSQVENPEVWRQAIRTTGELMRELGSTTLRMVDMGGGFPAYHKRGLPDIAEIAAVINGAIEDGLPYLPRKLAIEPGRGLVSDAGVMAATVIGVIERGGKKWVHLDLGGFTMMEALETGNTLDYPVADSRMAARRMTSNIVAATCDSMDAILYNDRGLSANLQAGDQVYVYTAGAYTASYASNFNGFNKPAMHYAVPELADFDLSSARLTGNVTAVQDAGHGRVMVHNPNGFAVWDAANV